MGFNEEKVYWIRGGGGQLVYGRTGKQRNWNQKLAKPRDVPPCGLGNKAFLIFHGEQSETHWERRNMLVGATGEGPNKSLPSE